MRSVLAKQSADVIHLSVDLRPATSYAILLLSIALLTYAPIHILYLLSCLVSFELRLLHITFRDHLPA